MVEVVHARCAGLDISKADAKVCVRVAGAGRRKTTETVTTWSAMTNQILALREHLAAEGVTCVVMEATGDYWKPFYYLLEDLPGVRGAAGQRPAREALPGRKTDVADATWLAQLGAHGLVRGSFVPPEPIRQLRDLTRARTAITRERSREIQRLEKLLEDAGIKLSSVASDITGVSGRAMLAALIDGQRDPAVLADLAKRRLRSKIPALTEALTGRFTDHHAFLARVHLDLIDRHTAAIDEITARIEVVIEPFRAFRDLICTIPGIGTDQRRRHRRRDRRGHDPVPHRRAPGLLGRHHARAQRVRRAGQVDQDPTRQPLPAGSPRRRRDGLRAEPEHLPRRPVPADRRRRGPQKANVAVQRTMLTAIWHMGTTGTFYDDPGADYFTRLHPERAKARAIHQLQSDGIRSHTRSRPVAEDRPDVTVNLRVSESSVSWAA